jgi:hypothetical protein
MTKWFQLLHTPGRRRLQYAVTLTALLQTETITVEELPAEDAYIFTEHEVECKKRARTWNSLH